MAGLAAGACHARRGHGDLRRRRRAPVSNSARTTRDCASWPSSWRTACCSSALWRAAQAAAVRVYCPAELRVAASRSGRRARCALADGAELAARLVVGADGADSWVRDQAGIAVIAGRLRPARSGRQLFLREAASRRSPSNGSGATACSRCFRSPGDRVSMVWSIARESAERLLALPADDLAGEVARREPRRARRARRHHAAGRFPAAAPARRAVREAARRAGRETPRTTCTRLPARA